MKQTFKLLVAAASVVSIVAAAGTASADPVKCHAAIGKTVAKYQATLVKNLAGCHKSRNAGKIGASTQCNTATGADLKGGRLGARQKVIDGINKACLAGTDDAVRALYPRCPSPVKTSDDAGATTGIDTFTELANCVLDLSESYVNKLGEEVLGNPSTTTLATPLTKGQQACVNGQAKALAGLIKAATGLTKCNAGAEGDGGPLGLTSTCISGAASAVTTSAIDFVAVINDACGAANMPARTDFRAIGLCGETPAQLAVCALNRVAKPVSQGLLAATQEFPNDGAGNLTCAAGSADVIINAGYGDTTGTGKRTNTRLDAGFTGFSHGVDVVDQYKGRVLLTNCDSDCENCDVRIDTSAGNCRCENDPTKTCDTIEGADANDCGGNTCHCMFGPPLALSASSTPTCVVNRFASDFSGKTGAVGEYDVTTATRALVHTGISQLQPCPTCSGTTIGAAGTCNGGPRNGGVCHTDAVSPDFGPSSFDCPPDPLGNISGAGLKLALQFSSGTKSITAGIANPLYCKTGTCHCSVCSGDSLLGCSTDAECAAAGAGTCGQNYGTANPEQNQCDGGPSNCVADPANPGMGLCNAGPYDNFCDGASALRANGGGIIKCTDNTDCDALASTCGGDCGKCEKTVQRSCFLPTVSATGTPGIFSSEGVSAFCNPPTGNSGVNAAGGLPGPGRVRLDFDFNVWCSGGHTTQFNLPLGSNCP